MDSFSQACWWLFPFGLLVLSIVAVPLRILDDQGLPRYQALKQELVEVNRTNRRLHREVESLQGTVEALRTDLDAIEAVARDELGMVRPGELVVQF